MGLKSLVEVIAPCTVKSSKMASMLLKGEKICYYYTFLRSQLIEIRSKALNKRKIFLYLYTVIHSKHCTNGNNNIESMFLNQGFSINFA